MKKIIRILILSMWITFWMGPGNALIAQSQPEPGFCFLEENDFYFHTNSYFNRLTLRSSPTRIWRVFQPADNDPASKPLFVFFNGVREEQQAQGSSVQILAGMLFLSTHRQARVQSSSIPIVGPASEIFSTSTPAQRASPTA
jgi:hypothetical protein